MPEIKVGDLARIRPLSYIVGFETRCATGYKPDGSMYFFAYPFNKTLVKSDTGVIATVVGIDYEGSELHVYLRRDEISYDVLARDVETLDNL